jgi:alkylation response protein AidB-like acyl-CoA dehydrogenase
MDAEEQKLLRATTEHILRDTPFYRVDESCPPFDHGRWRTLAAAGLLAVRIEADLGGSGMGLKAMSIIGEVVGRLAPTLPFLGTVALFGELVRLGGRDDQRRAWLPQLAEGTLIGAFACHEPGTADVLHPSTRAELNSDGIRLRGTKILVLGGPYADEMLVNALTPDGRLLIVAVDPRGPGISRTDSMTFDGMAVSDVVFDDVQLPAEALLGHGENTSALIENVTDGAVAMLCAEAASTAALMNERTKAYCEMRVAFGQPLASQQVVRHRVVDMHVAREYLAALADRANRDDYIGSDARRRAVSAAKAAACHDGQFIAQSAVQLHGAIGTTEELDVGRMFRRMTAIGLLFGSRDYHLRRFWNTAHSQKDGGDRIEEVLGELSPDELEFRNEVRDFYAKNLTPEFRRAGRLIRWSFAEFEYGRRWQKILYERGWGAPHWPVRYGGTDWSTRQRIIFAIETMAARPPAIMMMGRDLCAPCIMEFGTEEQKAAFLPRILDGSDWWAQGYSEPQAGSDLASLQLRADGDGDFYVLNGSKIWTTYAHHANRIFCLVRTSREDRPQKGITFLLIEMDTPGIEVRPIIGMGGDHEFNQVFFTDVRVPKSCRLGAEGEGWTIARYLLRFEHGASVTGPMLLREWMRHIELLAARGGADGKRLIDDPDFSHRLSAASIDLEAAETIAVRELATKNESTVPAVYAEMINLRLRAVRQHLTELMVEAAGQSALVHRPELLQVATSGESGEEDLAEALAIPLYFSQRAASIAGGTPEIHRNNIARHIFHKDASR